jgi:hypothetical protein
LNETKALELLQQIVLLWLSISSWTNCLIDQHITFRLACPGSDGQRHKQFCADLGRSDAAETGRGSDASTGSSNKGFYQAEQRYGGQSASGLTNDAEPEDISGHYLRSGGA